MTRLARPRGTLATLVLAGALAACASQPPAEPALAASAASLDAARAAGAAELAPAAMNTARNKLERARAMAQTGRNREAIRTAEQADADARLARASAAGERSQRALAEVEASLRTLRAELERMPPASPTPPSSRP